MPPPPTQQTVHLRSLKSPLPALGLSWKRLAATPQYALLWQASAAAAAGAVAVAGDAVADAVAEAAEEDAETGTAPWVAVSSVPTATIITQTQDKASLP